MQDGYDNYMKEQAVYNAQVIDEKLRAHMLGIYRYMAGATLTTALVALYVSSNQNLFQLLFASKLGTVFLFLPLVLVLAMSFLQSQMSAAALKLMFFCLCSFFRG